MPFVASMYASPTPLWLRRADHFHLLWSATGVQQGDPLGPILFALAFHRVLRAVSSRHPGLQLVAAYLDDLTIAGTGEECKRALQTVCEEAQFLGLRVNGDKSTAFTP